MRNEIAKISFAFDDDGVRFFDGGETRRCRCRYRTIGGDFFQDFFADADGQSFPPKNQIGSTFHLEAVGLPSFSQESVQRFASYFLILVRGRGNVSTH